MSVVIDTSAWIEWLVGSPTADRLMQHWPVAEEAADQALAYLEQCRVVVLDTRIALNAAELCAAHRLAAADAIVYATALEHEATLLTCDAHFEGLAGVVFVAKG
jgi:predicted nucleic acid-binding protein